MFFHLRLPVDHVPPAELIFDSVAFKAAFHLGVGTFQSQTTVLLKAGERTSCEIEQLGPNNVALRLSASTPTFRGRLGGKAISTIPNLSGIFFFSPAK